MSFPLTEEQRQVVNDRGGGLLVSAAAGSGKTRVLVERLLDRVVRERKNIDQFLIITYTRAAAAELRARIAEELNVRLAEHPEDRHLRRQTNLVYKAQISTIHAFCADLLREWGHLLDLEPDFRLCDEQESGVLRLRVLNDVLEHRYEQIEEEGEFAQLVDILSAGRDDSLLIQITLDIFDRIQSHPQPEQWLKEQSGSFDLRGVSDAWETVWGKLLLEDAAGQARHWIAKMEHALALTDSDPGLEVNYGAAIGGTIEGLRAFAAAASGYNWDATVETMPVPFPPAGRKKMGDCPEAERVKGIRNTCKARMEKLAEWFQDDSAVLLSDLRRVAPAVRGLFALISDFSAALSSEKRRRGILDFSDLEHFAVSLLTDLETGEETEVARQMGRRYTEIMVDEYQDTNEVQNAIFNALSGNGGNLFLVGDVKQSIYRFRLADPTIFLEKYRRFPHAAQAKEGEPRKLLLSRNFRSRAEVLAGVNDVFLNIMSTELGEMEYTEDEMLYPGAEYPPSEEPCVELSVIDTVDVEEEPEDGKPDSYLLEARFVAARISQLLGDGFQVTEGGALRPVRPGDMVVLLRSPGTVVHHYARALNEQGIPWQADGDRDFFGAAEVQVALSLLQVVDNPRQDIPLISVLRSPVYGFSADRLAQLRAEGEGDFYASLRCGAQRGETDCVDFLSELSELRFRAGEKCAHELIWELYERTGLPALYGAMPGGAERQANLLTLYELARSCEESGHKGLFGFLTYLERLREAGGRVSVPGSRREGGGVRILSIHKSKGLEFPVVFLCGLSKRFNREDLQKPVLFHSKLGVGPKWLDRERMIQSPTLARRAVARQLEREMLAEELRLLYVAMTRAKEKLIMTCTVADREKTLSRLKEDAGCPVEPQALLARESVGQWLLLAAMCRPEAVELRPEWDGMPLEGGAFGPPWQITVHPGREYARASRAEVCLQSREDGSNWEELEESLRWKYPYGRCTDIPSKLTATQLKGRLLDQEAAEDAPGPRRRGRLRRPSFAEEELGLTPAEKGTALHLVMQYLDFARTDCLETLRKEIDRLVELALITPQQGTAAAPERLLAFFQSPLGQRVRAADRLHREFKFSLLVPAVEYYPDCPPEEEVLLQGVVDCWLEEPEGITLIDFKTDQVTETTVADRANAYRPQLDAYRRALEKMTGQRVAHQILWFFALDWAVEL